MISELRAASMPAAAARSIGQAVRARAWQFLTQTRTVVTAVGVIGVFLIWSIGYVPPNMDEFNHPYRLACLYPYAHLNTSSAFIISCGSYLVDYGLFSYHRGFQYIGSMSSVLYFPVWFVWRSPVSYHLMGALFLLAFSWALIRSLNLRLGYILIPLSYFPIAYSLIHDTGPLRLSLLSYPLVVILLNRLLDDPRVARKLLCAVTGGVLMALSVEDKPFYLMVLPSLALFVVACRSYANSDGSLWGDVAKNKGALLVFASVFVAGSGFVLFLGTTEGRTYFDYLKNVPLDVFSLRSQAASLLVYTFSFPKFAHRVFEIPRLLLVMAGLMTALLAASAVFVAWRSRVPDRRTLTLFCLSYAAGALVFLIERTPWAGHHFVYLHLPALALLLLFARANARRFAVALGALVVLNLTAIGVLQLSTIDAKSARERTRIFQFVSQQEIAKTNIINFSSFGGYYHQALFGDDRQLVTWSHSGRRNQEPAIELQRLAGQLSRNIINVCRDCDLDLMRAFFATKDVSEVDLGLREWKVFQIAMDGTGAAAVIATAAPEEHDQ